ncbi:fructoselysine 3-epimerase [Rosistilla oblonga]|uniref:sugar phosphate isomerase/epimerase family protein n=1 Tax=Rosistilla oblonga TaxID=2527990 RepID=UPI00118A8F79|nr:sugar phosphate isomerase/epimerase family protein [Rosistilla oblonga]QDV12188.1 fructoselysine 3-epimerase [Rosistilla oblonga]
MSASFSFSRRDLLRTAAPVATAAMFAPSAFAWQSKSKILNTLKIGMVKIDGASLEERFRVVKEVGFDGIEMNSPGMDVAETKAAIKATGLVVDGTVCAGHWGIRHTSPDAATRAKALENLKIALRDTKAVGGDTVLLVVGKGEDGPEQEIWERSVENISKAVPLAEELNMKIAIENVWNQFLYDHEGDSNQSADKFVKYVDEFNSPAVGMQFDIGNHWKYGNTGDWIRTLGKRIVKLDSKGFSRANNRFTKIGEGDIDWKDVRAALTEIGFEGWCAAEVGGGGKERLAEVLANMKRTLG